MKILYTVTVGVYRFSQEIDIPQASNLSAREAFIEVINDSQFPFESEDDEFEKDYEKLSSEYRDSGQVALASDYYIGEIYTKNIMGHVHELLIEEL